MNAETGYNFAYLDEGTKRMIRRAILKAIVVSSEPWSMTLRTSLRPRMAAVTCTPPVPQP
jgi:alpha-D-ribose 1-methylphosphonate 5-phosphate C-P lyase